MYILRAFLLLAILSIVNLSSAQQYRIDTLQYQGTNKHIVNMVILADGYTAAELDYFVEDARRFNSYFFNTEPFRQYTSYFNVFCDPHTFGRIRELFTRELSNACRKERPRHGNMPVRFPISMTRNTNVPASNPKTIFGSSFDNMGLHRLVIPHHEEAIQKVFERPIFQILFRPSPNTLDVKWILNGESSIDADKEAIHINRGMFHAGTNELKAIVYDNTKLVRTEEHAKHIYTAVWSIHAEKETALTAPVSTWGDTLETCFQWAIQVRLSSKILQSKGSYQLGYEVPPAENFCGLPQILLFRVQKKVKRIMWRVHGRGRYLPVQLLTVRVLPAIDPPGKVVIKKIKRVG
ncbi:hypothetical protein FQR65_LT18453 [Abscondita terminalis]|nr:hypothetical protein FQR65_LT18453 [Abscondita terminalis]